jgi:multidrug efflux pump subunit AcrB
MITIGAIKGSVIKTTFFPSLEADYVAINLEMPAGTPYAITDSILQDLEKSIEAVNNDYMQSHNGDSVITAIARKVGPNTHEGSLSAPLIEGRYRDWPNSEIAKRIREYVGVVEGAELLEVDDGGGFFGKPVSIVLKSDNLEKLQEAKNALKVELKKVDNLTDVIDDNPPGLREVKVTLKDKAFALGLTTNSVLNQVRGGFFGSQAQRILRGVDEVKIYVRYDMADRSSIDDLRNMRIRTSDGREFPLEEIATFEIKQGVMSIKHIDARRVITVEANISDPIESVTDILADIETDIMPGITARYPEVDFAFEGQSRESAKTTSAMMTVIPAVLVLMFLIIVVTFRSFVQAGTVILLIPFSLIGVAWGHYFQGYFVSMLSLFGTIALAGIVINNSLVFVSAFNRYMKNGMKFKDALIETGSTRFRPVLLTSLTTIAGLGPLIFETSFHAQFLSPMAISIAYGLFFGTLLTLLLLPALLVLVNRFKMWVPRVFLGKEFTPEKVESAVREERFSREQNI